VTVSGRAAYYLACADAPPARPPDELGPDQWVRV